MLVVTGTRRSGTSMWMQVLAAAGLPIIGDRFPLDWEHALGPLNPRGFYESSLRDGIYFATNPHPRSGEYLHPAETRLHAVKVFPEGLVRSDLAFLDRVLVTVRPWHEYAASLARLFAIENAARGVADADRPPRPAPALEWWAANFALVRDVAMRRYGVHMQSYASVLADPAAVVPKVLEWIGDWPGSDLAGALDIGAAVAAVHADGRTIVEGPREGVLPEHAAVFDDYYAAIHAGAGLDASLLARMNETQRALAPSFAEHEQALARWLEGHGSRPGLEPLALTPSATVPVP